MSVTHNREALSLHWLEDGEQRVLLLCLGNGLLIVLCGLVSSSGGALAFLLQLELILRSLLSGGVGSLCLCSLSYGSGVNSSSVLLA